MGKSKSFAKNIARRILRSTGVRPYNFGINLFDDIKARLPNQNLVTIFDVGANEGQTTRALLDRYPDANISCFEPNPECADKVRKLDLRLSVYELALGKEPGKAGFDGSKARSDMFFLTDDLSGETVDVDTIDNFCERTGIRHIDLLKIDTEGHDLNVILGSENMLAARNIDILQAEVSMNADNKFHVGFFDVQAQMERSGYRLFGLYEQMFEWPTREPHLRRANAVYISPKVIEANRIS
jgi:FkbM family methyltransferase